MVKVFWLLPFVWGALAMIGIVLFAILVGYVVSPSAPCRVPQQTDKTRFIEV